MAEKTVLLADDDADLSRTLALRLKQLGVLVFRSPDAMHALLGAHRAKPDLVILDVNMPGGNGLSVCEMLAGDNELAKVPVIVMTGQTDDEVRKRCDTLGARYVAKGSGLWDRLQPLVTELLELIPAPRASETQAEQHKASAAVPINRQPKILSIDDDPEISKILKLRLEPHGVDVIRAFNGMQGYWTAIDVQPDVIITDLGMPDGEGNYIFGRLKMHPLTENTPVIVLTGESNPAVRRHMLSMGVDAFLSKPLVLEDLLRELRRHIPLSVPQPAARDVQFTG